MNRKLIWFFIHSFFLNKLSNIKGELPMTYREDITLEELIQQTEDKITNNEYFEDCTVVYKDYNVHLRIRPISQARFAALSKNKSDEPVSRRNFLPSYSIKNERPHCFFRSL